MDQRGETGDEKGTVDQQKGTGKKHLQKPEIEGVLPNRSQRPPPVWIHIPHGEIEKRSQQNKGEDQPSQKLGGFLILVIRLGSGLLLPFLFRPISGLLHRFADLRARARGIVGHEHRIGQKIDADLLHPFQRGDRFAHMRGAGSAGHPRNFVFFVFRHAVFLTSAF